MRGEKARAAGPDGRRPRRAARLGRGAASGPTRIHLRVFADNEHAIGFYRRAGFRDAARSPLRREVGRRGRPLRRLRRRPRRPLVPRHGLGARPRRRRRADPHRRPLDLAARGQLRHRRRAARLERPLERLHHPARARVRRVRRRRARDRHLELHRRAAPGDGRARPRPRATRRSCPSRPGSPPPRPCSYTGATPVFADVEPGSWCLDPASVEARDHASARRRSSPSTSTATRPTWTLCAPSPTATGCP